MTNAPRMRFERRWAAPPVRQLLKAPTEKHGFDFTGAMAKLVHVIARTSPAFAHLDHSRIFITAVVNRTKSPYGLQARVTPMRFKDGALTTRRRGMLYGLQRYYVNDVEMLYLLTFVLPRFLNQPFEEKLTTVFHELYHMSPAFDGDFRRLGGRCCVHSKSKKGYDAHMASYANEFLQSGDHSLVEFLRWNFDDFQRDHGGVRVAIVPCPRLVPISKTS